MRRREFVTLVARAGGSAAALGTMDALGLLPRGPDRAFALGGSGRGRRVLVLGAGLTGMAAAYELGKLGYDCRVLEARARSGGRCWTLRGGTEVVELDGTRQRCEFSAGQYLNAGPMRIPHTLPIVLDYCRELGVAVEPFVLRNEATFLFADAAHGPVAGRGAPADSAPAPVGPLGNRRVRVREARTDVLGFTAELLAKAVNQGALDAEVTAQDRAAFLDYLRQLGLLDGEGRYGPRSARGWSAIPTVGADSGRVADPLALRDLVQAGFANRVADEHFILLQPTLLQVTGGTDELARALERRLPGKVRLGAEVVELRREGAGARVVVREGGRLREERADAVVCTLPSTILARIPGDLSPAHRHALASLPQMVAGKAGLEFDRRFWEEDDRVYGGVSVTNLPSSQIYYPSHGFLGARGVLIGYYVFGARAEAINRLAPRDRLERALADGERIHPPYRRHFRTGTSVAWERIPFSEGGWARWTDEARRNAYPVLLEPDGPFVLAGDYLTHHSGWMAGAFLSARDAAAKVHARLSQLTPTAKQP